MTTQTPEDRPLKILIAEDHELVRYGLVLSLEEKGHVHITGEAENGLDALKQVAEHLPDMVLMDIGMPVMDGITATQRIKTEYPGVKVIMLTSHKDQEEVYASLAAGADAYCMKDIKIDRLCQVLEMVMEGALWLDPAIAEMVMRAIPGTKLPDSKPDEQNKRETELAPDRAPEKERQWRRYNTELTAREQEVLQLIVEGKSNKEIAQVLNVTTHTAKAHVGNIIQKLAVDDRTQAAVKAIQQGYVEGFAATTD